MSALPLARECPLCREWHEISEYTADDIMAALCILDARITGNSDQDSLPVSPHPGFKDNELQPIAELLGLVLRKLTTCPLCGGPHYDSNDEEDSSACACECHEDVGHDED
jgi:hypothetical protein